MTKQTSLAETETFIEFVSSHTVRTLNNKKKLRRRLILAVFIGTKIAAAGLAYLGYAELGSHRASAGTETTVTSRQ